MNSERAALLLSLARDSSPQARARLVDEAALAYTSGQTRPSETEMTLFADIMQMLLAEAEQDVRRRLAIAVKNTPWASRTLISSLAFDVAAVAAPVIASSPVIDDAMLVSLVQERGSAHRSLVASRPNISERVSSAIVATKDELPILTLATNASARIARDTLREAIEYGRERPDVLEAYGLRTDLPTDLIILAYSYAGAAVRASLAGRDDVDPAQLDAAVAAIAIAAAHDKAQGNLTAQGAATIAQASRDDTPRGPTPGVLLQNLMNGRKDLFVEGLAQVTGMSVQRITQAICYGSKKSFIVAARAAGFDVASVAGVHVRLFGDDQGRAWSPTDDALVHETFAALTPRTAIDALIKGVE